MSMLAEPRRKQKWSVDPRNTTWVNDTNKFGQKMMEKMGWSSGKGLGANEQGSTNHIKVNVKNNSLGVGAAINQEDKWIAHQDDFNQLLADLNDQHGQQEATEQAQKAAFSLEEKSKQSRKRVHYMKFAKGKDLSTRSADDLACVFGKRAKKSHGETERDAPAPAHESEEEQRVSESPSPPPPAEADDSLRQTTSTLSVQEYFAKKMADARRGAAAAVRAASAAGDGHGTTSKGRKREAGRRRMMDEPGEEESDPAGDTGEENGPGLAGDAEENASEKKKRHKEKKRRRREEREEMEREERERANTVDNEEESAEQDPPSEDIERPRKKKDKKKKNKNKSKDSD